MTAVDTGTEVFAPPVPDYHNVPRPRSLRPARANRPSRADRGAPRRLARTRGWLRTRTGRIAVEVLFIGVLYLAYSMTRLRFTAGYTDALHNAHKVLGTEGPVAQHLDLPLNHAVVGHALLGVPAAWYYATAHYLCTLAMLVWLWRRHPLDYARARTGLVVITLIGLAVFVTFPVAPPRLVHGTGFIDGMARWSSFGFWGDGASAPRGAEQFTNQYAAVPSLHVGWALWCAWWSFKLSRSSRSRWTAWLHPLITAVVVVATANHYTLDVVAGVIVVLLGEGLCSLTGDCWWRLRRRRLRSLVDLRC